MEMNDRLKAAYMSRAHLAELVGVSTKTTYNWGAEPPQYVLTIIKQYRVIFIHDQVTKWRGKL